MAHRETNKSAFNGAVAGMTAGILLQPLEVLKINLILMPKQFNSLQNVNFFRSFFQAIKVINKEEGLKGFYRGSIPSVMSSCISAGIFFGALNQFERLSNSSGINKQLGDFLSSASARSLASLLVNPLNIWKTRAEILGYNEYRSVTDSVRKIYALEGFYGFFKGSLLMMVRDFPFGGIFYVSYRAFNHVLHKFSDHNIVYLTSALMAGLVSTTITHPVEIMLARTQADNTKTNYQKGMVMKELKSIYRNEGPQGWFKGLFPRLIRKPITNALTFFIFEILNKRHNKSKVYKVHNTELTGTIENPDLPDLVDFEIIDAEPSVN